MHWRLRGDGVVRLGLFEGMWFEVEVARAPLKHSPLPIKRIGKLPLADLGFRI